MRLLITAIFVLFFISSSESAYYIVNMDNKVIAKMNYQPSQADLDTRNEISIYTKDEIPLDKVEYRNGKIVEHTKTSGELETEKNDKDKQDEIELLWNKMKKMACDALEVEGHVFTTLKCADFSK